MTAVTFFSINSGPSNEFSTIADARQAAKPGDKIHSNTNGYTTATEVVGEYTKEVKVVNGVTVTKFGGTKKVVPAYDIEGHGITGWIRRSGARTVYAELTCTCHLHGESRSPEGEGIWISHGSEGWADRLNALALAHVNNVTLRGFMVRPAGGDRSRWADRTRLTRDEMLDGLEANCGLSRTKALAVVEAVTSGKIVTLDDGNRFELAMDREGRGLEAALPIH